MVSLLHRATIKNRA